MPFDPEPYAAGLRELNNRERRRIAERAARARDAAKRIAARVGESDPSIRTVYLFGSLATGEPRRLDFDIDLAIEGGDVYAAETVAETVSADAVTGGEATFPCDIVSLERLPEHVRDRIHASGLVLYRRPQVTR